MANGVYVFKKNKSVFNKFVENGGKIQAQEVKTDKSDIVIKELKKAEVEGKQGGFIKVPKLQVTEKSLGKVNIIKQPKRGIKLKTSQAHPTLILEDPVHATAYNT